EQHASARRPRPRTGRGHRRRPARRLRRERHAGRRGRGGPLRPGRGHRRAAEGRHHPDGAVLRRLREDDHRRDRRRQGDDRVRDDPDPHQRLQRREQARHQGRAARRRGVEHLLRHAQRRVRRWQPARRRGHARLQPVRLRQAEPAAEAGRAAPGDRRGHRRRGAGRQAGGDVPGRDVRAAVRHPRRAGARQRRPVPQGRAGRRAGQPEDPHVRRGVPRRRRDPGREDRQEVLRHGAGQGRPRRPHVAQPDRPAGRQRAERGPDEGQRRQPGGADRARLHGQGLQRPLRRPGPDLRRGAAGVPQGRHRDADERHLGGRPVRQGGALRVPGRRLPDPVREARDLGRLPHVGDPAAAVGRSGQAAGRAGVQQLPLRPLRRLGRPHRAPGLPHLGAAERRVQAGAAAGQLRGDRHDERQPGPAGVQLDGLQRGPDRPGRLDLVPERAGGHGAVGRQPTARHHPGEV
ncbi:MAG: hypothetical protein AVDCRST_MAG41-1559, partial [uncultured Corynebacteriales bacterium]